MILGFITFGDVCVAFLFLLVGVYLGWNLRKWFSDYLHPGGRR
jgi:hypothetical protein